MKGEGGAVVGSRLQSICTTQRAKVDTLMPSGFFHTFRTGRLPVGLAVFERWERSEFKNYFIQGFVVRVLGVARIARVIAVGVAHHVTQRGVGRRFLLESEADRQVYLCFSAREPFGAQGYAGWLLFNVEPRPFNRGS